MKLAARLMLAFALVGLFAAGMTAWLGYRAASAQFERVMMGNGAGLGSPDQPGRGMGQMARGGQRGQQVLEELRGSSTVSFVVAAGVALAVGGYLAHRLVQPVRALTLATHRYGHGDREARVPVVGNDELTDLARTFNRVAEQLANREAQDRRMVADIAHELRTPLTVMKGELEALQDGLLEATPDTFGRLVEEVDLLERLVRDLRLLSLAEAGQLRLNQTTFDLADLARSSLESFTPRAEARGAKLESVLAFAPMNADLERVRQVLYNLLENALRHTPEGGTVWVKTQMFDSWVVLTVTDTGAGIPAEHLPHLFERFYRAESARGRESGGSGLGLAIVKAIVEAHGGSVRAKNGLETGAVFEVRLPAANSETR